jgi:cytochrome b561
MAWLSDGKRYGSLVKALHWLIVLLFALQFAGGVTMTRLPPDGGTIGIGKDALYNWHKSLGLVALAIACLRLWARGAGALPPWAPSLSAAERTLVHRYEKLFYGAMFLMPVSGFIYVMAGGYGVLLFGIWSLPNPIGVWKPLATLAGWLHVLGAAALGLGILLHAGLVLRHIRHGLLQRML